MTITATAAREALDDVLDRDTKGAMTRKALLARDILLSLIDQSAALEASEILSALRDIQAERCGVWHSSDKSWSLFSQWQNQERLKREHKLYLERDALASRLTEAERLLKPFAALADEYDGDWQDDDGIASQRADEGEEDFTVGDLRAASTFLTRSEDNG